MTDGRKVVLPLATVHTIEDALKFAETHHTSPAPVRESALAAWQELRRNWRWADAPEGEARA